MGARLCRHRRPLEPDSDDDLPPGLVTDSEDSEPEVAGRYTPTKVFHEDALRRRRAKLSATWKSCGNAKKKAGQVAYNQRRPVPSWARFVQHKLLQHLHHLHSQILKEVKCIAREEFNGLFGGRL